MENIYPRPSRACKLFLMVTAVSIALGTPLLRAQDVTLLSLGAGDVHKAVILVTKPSEVILEVTYSKAKQAEFFKASQMDLPKKITIALNGQVVSERTITQPLSGHSIKIPMTTADDAFARAVALMPLLRVASSAPVSAATSPPADTPVFSVSSDAISTFAVFMYNPSTVWMDLTLGDKEKAELAQLMAKNSGGKIQFSLDGKRAGELQIGAGNAGSSVRIVVSNIDQAMALTKSLMNKDGKVDP
jgi:hypothetical protein